MYARLADRLRSHRQAVLMAFDGAAWVLAIFLFTFFRYNFQLPDLNWSGALWLTGLALALQYCLGWTLRLYQGRAALGTLEEMLLVGLVTGAAAAIVFATNFVNYEDLLPRSVPLGAAFVALGLMAWGRAVWRLLREQADRVVNGDGAPVLIYGAGDAGRQLVRSMLRDPKATWQPIGFIDDDPWKRHLRVDGLAVLGTRQSLPTVVDKTAADTVILALPSADAAQLRKLSSEARKCGLTVKVLPGVHELPTHSVGISDIRDIDVADLLGRHQVETDVASIAGCLSGRRVLVTGAGGSIGSELCRQIHTFGPAELIMLDRDESALHAVQLSIYGRALLDSPDVVLGDIRDGHFLTRLFEDRRPHVVFHAAALKHLPMLEQYPGEAVKTNVWGTLTLLEAAKEAGVEKFVNISTDKAANPVNVLGYSKRLAEMLTAGIAEQTAGTYLSVRFGNVLGSRGSVLTSFAAQIAAGGPVTVTHPEVTRYFMTIQEAVQLVIQAAAIGYDGEALILDMGNPVCIDEVARHLIDLSGAPVEINYTGLRAGEKLHEELFGAGEPDKRLRHPMISHVSVPGLDTLAARELDPWAEAPSEVRVSMAKLCASLEGVVL